MCFLIVGRIVGGLAIATWVAHSAVPANLQAPLATLKAVGPEGRGNTEARQAWATVAAADATAIPVLLAAMDNTNDYALNWLRAAIEAIVQREKVAGRKLSVADLEAFLREPQHHPRARRLAYELIVLADPTAARNLLPGLVNDPSNELRRDAVQLQVDAAAAKTGSDRAGALAEFQTALGLARDPDQIEDIAKRLGDLGVKVDLAKTFGWVTKWKLIGPFDNTGGVGFNQVFPPEQQLDLAAEYDGKSGKVRWQDYETRSEYGLVDFNQPLTALKGVTGYAFAEFWCDAPRQAEIRLGGKNSWKVWANGQLLFGRDEYHQGAEIDQYRMPVQLKAGRNILLVKCCQNEEKQEWTKEWEFQLRVTDVLGTPLITAK